MSGFYCARLTLWILLLFVSCRSETDKWTTHLMELKAIMSVLDAKISTLDGKLSNFQVLDYAFKVNSIDNHIRSIDTKMNHIAVQIDGLKDSLKSTCSTTSQLERTGGEKVSNNELMEKIEDYGQKVIVSNFELLQMAQKEEVEMVNLKNISRSGFSKLYNKVDRALEMEGQMSALSQRINGWSPRLTKITEQLTDLSSDADHIRSKVEQNGAALTNIAKTSSDDASRQNVDESDPIGQALRTANRMKIQISSVEASSSKIKAAADMARHLNTVLTGNIPNEDAETMKNLVFELTGLEKSFNLSIKPFMEDFNKLHAILKHGRHVISNKTASECKDVYKMELLALKDMIANKVNCSEHPAKSSLGCLTDFPNKLSNIQKATGGMDIVSKLQYIGKEVMALQVEARQKCDCDSKREMPLGIILG